MPGMVWWWSFNYNINLGLNWFYPMLLQSLIKSKSSWSGVVVFITDYNTTLRLHWVTLGCGNSRKLFFFYLGNSFQCELKTLLKKLKVSFPLILFNVVFNLKWQTNRNNITIYSLICLRFSSNQFAEQIGIK